MSIEDYYYRLEEVLASRSIISETYEDLEEFKIKEEIEKPGSIDPYVCALCSKYGIYRQVNIEGFFLTLTCILEGVAVSEKWNDIDIKKFVYYQLSDYYLKYKYNAKLQQHYLDLAVTSGHRAAIQEEAELMFSTGGEDKIPRVIELCNTAIKLGNNDCYVLLIECYTKTKNFTQAIETYEKFIEINNDHNAIKDFHLFINTHCDDEKYIRRYVEILIKSSNKFTINYILLYKTYIDDNLIAEILLDSDKNEKRNTVLLPKLLCIFNQEPELFANFIDLVCQRLRNI